MPQATIPVWEDDRLSALKKLRVFGTPAEERFDRITRLARKVFSVPISTIDLLGSDSVWLKSTQGFSKVLTPKATSYCSHTIVHGTLVVPDARQDPRLFDSPYANMLPFYAGVALRSEGFPVGVFCITGFEPRELGLEDLERLRGFARAAEQELKIARLSEAQLELAASDKGLLVDGLTKVWTKRAIETLLCRELRKGSGLGLLLIDIDLFTRVNDTHGHSMGDLVLRGVADRIRTVVRPEDAVGRYKGDQFLVALPNRTKVETMLMAERIREAIGSHPFESRVRATVSVGATLSTCNQSEEALLQTVDFARYRAKQRGRNNVEARWLTSTSQLQAIK